MTDSTKSAPETGVEAAQRQRAEAQQAADDARRIRAEVERQLADSQARLAAAEQQGRDAEQRIQEAENAARLAERDAMIGDHISRDRAVLIGRDILQLFADYRAANQGTAGLHERRQRFWDQRDGYRYALMTDDVEPSARGIVLAVEHLIGAADRWEHWRLMEKKAGRDPQEPRPGVAAHGTAPPDDPRVEKAEAELRRELDGEPPRAVELPGTLLGQGVELRQICRILDLVDGDGQPEISRFGALIDRAFERAGVSQAQPAAVRRYGALDVEDAWQIRQRRISSGRPDHLIPSVGCLPGETREGRRG